MRWIDHTSYNGPDRRERRFNVRIVERRRQSHDLAPPSVGIAMRQLRLRAHELATSDEWRAYRARVRAVTELASEQGLSPLASALRKIEHKLASSADHGAALRGAVIADLIDASELLVEQR